jgi:hypothetical protein
MREETRTLYTVEELKERFPDAYAKAYRRYKDGACQHEIPWSDEIVDSLKATLKAFGATLKDWSIGAWSNSYLKLDEGPDSLQCSGPRSFAVLERALEPFRIPFVGPKRWTAAKYGKSYRPGMVKPCPFTGVCFDEDFLDSIREDLKAGCTVRQALLNLAHVASRLIEAEQEQMESEEEFANQMDGVEFDADGDPA